MEKNVQTKNVLLAVLLVAVLTLSIAYAALSATLNINASAVVKAGSNWKVEFSGTSPICTASNYATVTKQPTLSGTSLTGLVATFKAPGDKVTCNFYVENKGTINAKLQTFTLGNTNLTYTGSGASKTADEGLVDGKINYTLVYGTGDSKAGSQPAANDTLPKPTGTGYKRPLVLTIEYDSSATQLPTNDVTVTGFNTTFLYQQN